MTSETNPKQGGRAFARGAAAALTILAAAGYAAVSLYRHDRFASNAFDLAVQDQTVWGYSRFEFIYNTVLGIPNPAALQARL